MQPHVSLSGRLTRREALVRLIMVSWTLTVACRQDVRPAKVRGLVINVQSASFTMIQAFDLRTDSGEIWEFIVEGDVGITPSHLREHMTLADPVIVTIRYQDGLNIATLVEDAPHEP